MPRRLSTQFMAGITITLVLTLSANLVLVWRQQQRNLLTEMYGQAQTVANQLIATRLFIARNQDRINTSLGGHFEFKGLNPAAVGRGVGVLFADRTGARIKQTRFQARRPENAPDEFEREALTAFANDPSIKEYYRPAVENGVPVFRYAVPLKVERECLVCHGGPAGQLDMAGYPKEGLKLGELGGAISVALPMANSQARIRDNTRVQIWMIVGITLITLLVIYLLSRILVTDPLERLAATAVRIGGGELTVPIAELKSLHRSRELSLVADNIETMAQSLHELYTGLEAKVQERTRELAHANQLQSQFLATISHELRTPLTSIIAFTELLLKKASGQDREYLMDVLDSSRKLLKLVNNLLDLSRLEAGKVDLFTDLVQLPEILVTVERSLRPLADQKGLTLRIEPMSDLPLVLVDPLRVRQILLNLIGNAIKFTPEGGTVAVEARMADGWVEVGVRDTGPGIPEEFRQQVFEAFRRVESPGRQHTGSGLGLAIARNLVELHGGRIWVEEAVGGGSLFRFTLPAGTKEASRGDDEEDPGGR